MSDVAKTPKYEGPRDHYCEHPECTGKVFGSWGYERANKVIEWRCYPHRDLEYRSKSR